MILHAGLVAWRVGGRWRGALIEGASGAGKSDLMLRTLDAGATLVADDRVVIWASGERLYGRAPDTLNGLIEARGLDVMTSISAPLSEIVVTVMCRPPDSAIERLYDGGQTSHMGIALPRLDLHPLEASAPAKLRRSIERLGRSARPA